mgnify:CR=1 FL=1
MIKADSYSSNNDSAFVKIEKDFDPFHIPRQ